ncbi:MAG: radical SAM protein [bacterium]|nr:radical SAM protein [bacterium]
MHFDFITAFITTRCNMKCRTCFYRNSLNKSKDLSLEQWKGISKKISCNMLLLSGGEPFARKDIAELSLLFKPKQVIIPTNGTMVNFDAVECLCKNIPRVSISVSLDGVGEVHENIRGIKCWDRIVKTVEELVRLKKKHKNLEVIATTTINSINQDKFKPLFFFVRNSGFDRHFFEVIREFEWNKDISTMKNLEAVHKQILNYYATGNNWLETAGYERFYNLQRDVMKGKKWKFLCQAGKEFAIIDANGDMKLCEFLPTVGNLLKSTPEEIMKDKEAQKQLAMMRRHECDCTHCVAMGRSMKSNRWIQYLKSGMYYGLKHYSSNIQKPAKTR